MESPWLTSKQAAQYAQVSPRTLAEWLKAGLKCSRVGHTIRIHRDWLDEYLSAFSEQTTADAIVKEIGEYYHG